MRIIAMALIIPVLASCATQKDLIATGGSRADGTIDLSYEYGGFEQPEVNFEQGLITARERCAAWGYAATEPFGGAKQQCQAYSQYGCVRWTVTMTYQCTGNAAPPPS